MLIRKPNARQERIAPTDMKEESEMAALLKRPALLALAGYTVLQTAFACIAPLSVPLSRLYPLCGRAVRGDRVYRDPDRPLPFDA